ncbi:MAG: sugar phosphate nucleotidyltransferase [Patescibacteria group bacterium]
MENQEVRQTIPVVIMCGGQGTRLREETEYKPKPMVEIGGRPILWHIMKIYAEQGYKDFILCLGYRGQQIKDYFLNHQFLSRDFRLDLKTNTAQLMDDQNKDDFRITFADTGLDSLTAERLTRVKKYLTGPEFMLTYGDGVADVDLAKLLALHRERQAQDGVIGTITGIHPKSKYGLLNFNDRNVITSFTEKPRLPDYTNAGFMVLTRDFLPYCHGNEMIEESLIRATEDRKIAMYPHEGFWHCMDTYKDKEDLEKLWKSEPKWKIWT